MINFADTTLSAGTTAALSALPESEPAVDLDSLDTFSAPWNATLQTPDSDGGVSYDDPDAALSAALLIIHAPNGGAVHTYYSADSAAVLTGDPSSNSTTFRYYLQDAGFKQTVVDLCLNSPDLYAAGGTRRDIRLAQDGRSSSAVELVDVDDLEDNQCR